MVRKFKDEPGTVAYHQRYHNWTALRLIELGIALPDDELDAKELDDDITPEQEARWDRRIKACCDIYQSVWTDNQRIEHTYGQRHEHRKGMAEWQASREYQLPMYSETDLSYVESD
jgi:hypothetical protein